MRRDKEARHGPQRIPMGTAEGWGATNRFYLYTSTTDSSCCHVDGQPEVAVVVFLVFPTIRGWRRQLHGARGGIWFHVDMAPCMHPWGCVDRALRSTVEVGVL